MIAQNKLSLFSEGINPLKLQFLEDYLMEGNCLDIGCGNGLYGEKILTKCKNLLQADLKDRRLPEAKQYHFLSMDANQINLDEFFYNVIAFDIMEHLDNDHYFLKQIHRICRGRLILSVPNEEYEQPNIMGLTHMHHIDKTHKREYTRQSLKSVLVSNGFNILEIRPHYNRRIFYAAQSLAKGTFLSKVVAKTIYWQMLFYERIGLFENRCIADWFCAAEPV